jgi:hypothetical protein
VKTTIIALSVAALIVAAPALAQGAQGKTPGLQHKVSRKHHAGSGYIPLREMQARGSKKSYPRAFGYVPAEPGGVDRDLEMSRQAGGGGGGGGGGGAGGM